MKGLDSIIDRYDNIARKNLSRWQRAVDKVKANNYVSDDFFRDAMALWVDSTLGLWLGELDSVAVVETLNGIDTAQGTTKVSAPAAGALTATNLVLQERGAKPINNPTDPINAADVVPELSTDRGTLRVTIGKLKNLKAEPGAVYVGSVLVGTEEIAKIRAVVKS